MRRPVGVTVAALILGLMALFGLLVIALSFAEMFLMDSPALHEAAGTRTTMAGFDLISACFFVFCLWTVVGLFRLRRWARYSVVVIGAALFLLSLAISALLLVVRRFIPAAPPAKMSAAQFHLASGLLIFIAVVYLAFALIGLWWVIYFNLKSVRRAFAAAKIGAILREEQPLPETPDGAWHAVVLAFACLMLFGSLIMLGLASLQVFFFLGIIVYGKIAIAAYLIFAAIQLFVGIGLLRKLRPAYWTAIGWQVFGAINVALFLIPAYAARVLAAQSVVSGRFSFPLPTNQPAMLHMQREFMTLGGAISLVLMLFFLYALLRCRRWYVGGPEAQSI